jgi:hypothetical protein
MLIVPGFKRPKQLCDSVEAAIETWQKAPEAHLEADGVSAEERKAYKALLNNNFRYGHKGYSKFVRTT